MVKKISQTLSQHLVEQSKKNKIKHIYYLSFNKNKNNVV